MEKLRKIIQQEVRRAIMEAEQGNEPERKVPGNISTIGKDLSDQGSNYKSVTSMQQVVDLFNTTIVQPLELQNPEVRNQPFFKQAINKIYTTYK